MKKRIKHILSLGQPGDSVLVEAWVRTKRDSKGFSFIEVNDGSCLTNLQIIADETLENASELLSQVTTGTSLSVHGELVESPGKGQRVEVKATQIEMHGSADPESYPLQKKRHSNEFLRTIAHLRPRTNTFGAVFRVRNQASYAVHKFFQENDFVYLHSPVITCSDCEGAGQLFQVTTLDMDKPPRDDKGGVNYQEDFFGSPSYLTVSGQLEAEIAALALKDVYTFGPTFRAENSNTPRHLAEFWMIEPEMAFCDLAGNMELGERFIKYVINDVLEHCDEDMQFFNRWIEKGIIDSLQSVAQATFEHMTYDAAVEALQKSNKKFEFPVSWGADLQTEHERYLTEEFVGGPVYVSNYPKEIKAFYMRLDEGEKTVSAMDLLVPRLGEIIGGSQREEREDILAARINECDIDASHLQWYLELRRFGSVKHAGFGLGFERLIMYLTGMQNIRDVIPFPRTPGNASF